MKSIIPSEKELVTEYERLDEIRMQALHTLRMRNDYREKYSQCNREIARLVMVLDALYPEWYKR